MIEILLASAIVLVIVYVLVLRAEVKRIRIEIGFLKVRAGALRVDLDETVDIVSKAVQVLSEASTETMKAVIDLRAGK